MAHQDAQYRRGHPSILGAPETADGCLSALASLAKELSLESQAFAGRTAFRQEKVGENGLVFAISDIAAAVVEFSKADGITDENYERLLDELVEFWDRINTGMSVIWQGAEANATSRACLVALARLKGVHFNPELLGTVDWSKGWPPIKPDGAGTVAVESMFTERSHKAVHGECSPVDAHASCPIPSPGARLSALLKVPVSTALEARLPGADEPLFRECTGSDVQIWEPPADQLTPPSWDYEPPLRNQLMAEVEEITRRAEALSSAAKALVPKPARHRPGTDRHHSRPNE